MATPLEIATHEEEVTVVGPLAHITLVPNVIVNQVLVVRQEPSQEVKDEEEVVVGCKNAFYHDRVYNFFCIYLGTRYDGVSNRSFAVIGRG